MFKYVFVFDGDTKCAEFTLNKEEKKGHLVFSKAAVQSLPIKTAYDNLIVELFSNGLLEPIPRLMKHRTWEMTKVRMESIGQDEATFFATFSYGHIDEETLTIAT